MPRPAADNIDVATTVFVSKNPSGICKALSHCVILVRLPKINIVFCNLSSSFDAAATAHSEQAECVEGGRRGFAQDELAYKNTRLFFRNGTRDPVENPLFLERVFSCWCSNTWVKNRTSITHPQRTFDD